MAKRPNQKLKTLYLMKILLEKSDSEHLLTMPMLLDELEKYGIVAERKSIYDDIEALRNFGLDIELCPGKSGGYYIASRYFQLAEVKLLVDSVQASKFISERKTRQLIDKLEGLTNVYQAQALQRQVYVMDRIKTMNESIYYNVDAIHDAINQNRQISFRYFDYTLSKTKHYRKSGQFYQISPLALLWDDGRYYLIGYDSEAGFVKHYRVDKMNSIETVDVPRDGLENLKRLDLSSYSQKVFSMFGGEERLVTLSFKNELIGVVLDRFGKDVRLSSDGDDRFRICVPVQLSPQFYGWIFGLGDGVSILAPHTVKQTFRQLAQQAAAR